ncbi:chromosome segregation in meiosis- protein [Mortierella alpina]|uniref:Chromosome segregation in meiosis protein n=1 Tax=Mortierella alpina TaxID=64518 RepID=A0A9P6M5X9_MORAP|nr:chromosome segregation in meiosis- protein [Mortierella alpina]
MDDIRLEDEPFAPFDDYEDYADEMMQEAERQDQLMMQSTHQPQQQPPSAASGSTLPPQRDFLAMLNEQTQRAEQQAQAQAQAAHQQRPAQTTWQKKKGGATKGSRPIGSTASGAAVDEDLAAVNTVKKRVKMVRLDAEKLMSEKGFPLLINNGKRLKLRQKYKDTAEKHANAKQNLEDLMRFYQTWAHNLFPKATFRDFIVQAENKCKTKQLKQVMDGWRDAHWQQAFEKKQAAWEEERSEQTASEQQNNVWAEHESELAASEAATTSGMTPFNDSGSAGQSDHAGPSKATSTHPLFTGTIPSAAQKQARPRPAVSRKGKERAIDNPSAAMRLVASDDEEDAQQDYSAVMDRMRVSMNIHDTMDEDLHDSSMNGARRISANGGSFHKRALEKDDDEEQNESRRNEIDLDNYDSEVEDDEEEEEDEDGEQPLFTHRALKMMGGLEALEARNKSAVSADQQPEVAEPMVEPQARGDVSLSDEETVMELEDIKAVDDAASAAPVELKLSFDMGSQEKNTDSGGASMQQGEEDEEGLLAVRKPGRTRRLILMDDSDEE